ncbi:MAG: YlmC/YmxH family sporulation protein [Bacilli bacterium]|nr:YlmC/YmxH family sporulation protein [Bacilli bacterium]
MRLSELQEKDIVNLIDGKNLGKIIDVTVENGKMYNLIIEPKRFFLNIFQSREEITIRWENIEKIGEDVILVKNIN